jgi:arginyl-tRNA synthetase
MNIEQNLQNTIIGALNELYHAHVDASQITLQKTKKEFKGHYTLVTFPLLKISKKNPEQTAQEIGNYLMDKTSFIAEYNVIKGFLNLTVASNVWIRLLEAIDAAPDFGFVSEKDDAPLFMVEYSSPNTINRCIWGT